MFLIKKKRKLVLSYKSNLCVGVLEVPSILTTNQSMVINMLHNWNHTYYSYYNIIYYAINSGKVSTFMVFSEFVSVFLSMYYYYYYSLNQ